MMVTRKYTGCWEWTTSDGDKYDWLSLSLLICSDMEYSFPE